VAATEAEGEGVETVEELWVVELAVAEAVAAVAAGFAAVVPWASAMAVVVG